MSVEPRVEELLASIRKAIDDDLGSVGSSTSTNKQGTLMRGALREMRVSYGDDMAKNETADSEIIKLRERIGRSRIESNFTAPRPSKPILAGPAQRPVQREFSSILAAPILATPSVATPILSAPMPVAPPPLRRTLTDDDAYMPQIEAYAPAQADAHWEAEEPVYYADVEQQIEPYYPDAPNSSSALVSPQTAYAAQASFQALSESILAQATGNRGMEEVTREMLRGMLKAWLDENLPSVVERMVREEIERVARR